MIISHYVRKGWEAQSAANRVRSRNLVSIRGAAIFLINLAVLSVSIRVLAQGSDGGAVAETPAESAVRYLLVGSYSSAAQKLRRAMEVTPDDAAMNIAAGAVAISTGDPGTARSAFDHALRTDANDSLALYGLGLAHLAKGDRAGALNCFDRSEIAGGDRGYLLMARRYAQWLSGAQVSVAGAGVSEQLAPTQSALQGMQAAREGNWREAAALLASALNSLPGDAMVEGGGVLMNFDAAHPLTTGAARLPAGSLTVAPDRGALSGSVEVSPEGNLDGVSFVTYELDGKPLSIVNVRPFAYALDTRRVKNGQHILTVILHDGALHEIGRSDRKIRVVNSGSDDAANEAVRSRLRAMLWQALAVRPARCSGAYYLGLACRALGQPAAAQVWFARCVAIQPDYRDARRQWASCGGLAGEGGGALWGGLTTEKVVGLTFDDGPKPGVTEPLLEILRQERVPATFFVIGRHVMEYPELTKQIADAGMEIANHSYTHPNLTRLTDVQVTQEVMQTQAAVQSVTGRAPRFLRPPGGNWNPKVAQTARSWGLTPCMWTVDVYGSEVIGAQQVADSVLSQVRPGSIILMHNGKVSTLQALPTIIRALRSRGYAFATIDTMERRLGSARAARIQAADQRQRAE